MGGTRNGGGSAGRVDHVRPQGLFQVAFGLSQPVSRAVQHITILARDVCSSSGARIDRYLQARSQARLSSAHLLVTFFVTGGVLDIPMGGVLDIPVNDFEAHCCMLSAQRFVHA